MYKEREGSTGLVSSDEDRRRNKLTMLRSPQEVEDGRDEDDLDIDLNVHRFAHPSTYAPQSWIWIPKNDLGISGGMVERLRVNEVQASDDV